MAGIAAGEVLGVYAEHVGLDVLDLILVLLVEHMVDGSEAHVLVRTAVAGDVVVADGLHHQLADGGVERGRRIADGGLARIAEQVRLNREIREVEERRERADPDPRHAPQSPGRIETEGIWVEPLGVERGIDGVEGPLADVRAIEMRIVVEEQRLRELDRLAVNQLDRSVRVTLAQALDDVFPAEVGPGTADGAAAVALDLFAQLVEGWEGRGRDVAEGVLVGRNGVAIHERIARMPGPAIRVLDPLAQDVVRIELRAIGLALVDVGTVVVLVARHINRVALGIHHALTRFRINLLNRPFDDGAVDGDGGGRLPVRSDHPIERVVDRQGDDDLVA